LSRRAASRTVRNASVVAPTVIFLRSKGVAKSSKRSGFSRDRWTASESGSVGIAKGCTSLSVVGLSVTTVPKLRVAGSNPVSRSNPLAGNSSSFFEELPA
jgi:hypothetical protein